MYGLQAARRLLNIEDCCSSRRLRRLAEMLRDVAPPSPAPNGWTRLSPHELARIAVAIDLSGGLAALRDGRLRRLTTLLAACAALRAHPYGYSDPLLDVKMFRIGGQVLAEVEGVLLDPVGGQAVLQILPTKPGVLAAIVAGEHPDVLRYPLMDTVTQSDH